MVNVFDISADRFIQEAAKELKKMPEMAPPAWAICVKTGVSKERPPADKDWWYVRSAAVVRAVYKLGPVGVSKLRTKYGGRKNRGYAPDKTFKAGGNILRKILQKLELVGFLKQAHVGVHKGRVLTPKGRSFIDKLAIKLMKADKAHKATEAPKEVAKKQEEAVAEKAEKAEKAEHKKHEAKTAVVEGVAQ